MFAPLNKGRLYQGVIDQITQSVMSGKMRAGDQLPTEPELAEQFGVSRTVVREAMKALSLQGLVDVTPGRGTFVTQPPAEIVITSLLLMLKLEDHSLDDLMAARRLLEAPIARLAAENAQTSDIETLEANLRGMRTSLNDPDAFLEYDTAFHGHLARATHNMVLTVIAQPIILMMRSIRHSMAAVPDMAMRALHFHQALYEAVVSKDGAAAEKCMLEHLEQVAEDLERARQQGTTARDDGLPSYMNNGKADSR